MLALCVVSAAFAPPSQLVNPGRTRVSNVVMSSISRRSALGVAAAGGALLLPCVAEAADTEASLLAEIKEIRTALDTKVIGALLDEEKWDNVRSIWKVTPVNYAWEQSQNKKNPLRKLADLRDDIELLETAEEVAAAIQLADQYCYSNTFIYTQPGNGKVKIKEPKQQVKIAVDKIDASFLN